MADQWIVSSAKFQPHFSLESAEAERDRLFAQNRDKTYRVYRIKTSVRPGDGFGRAMIAIDDLLSTFAAPAFHKAQARERAQTLLAEFNFQRENGEMPYPKSNGGWPISPYWALGLLILALTPMCVAAAVLLLLYTACP